MDIHTRSIKKTLFFMVTLFVILACICSSGGDVDVTPDLEPECPYEDPVGGCAEWQAQSCQASAAVIDEEVSMDIWDQVIRLAEGEEYIVLEDTQFRLSGAGRADVDYGSGNKLTMYAPDEGDTVLDFDSWNGTRRMVLSAGAGHIVEKDEENECRTTVVAVADGGVVEITAKGTELFVTVSPGAGDNQVQVAVLSGEVEVKDVQGNIMTVSPDLFQTAAAVFITDGRVGQVVELEQDNIQLSRYLRTGRDILGRPIQAIERDDFLPTNTPTAEVLITPTPTPTLPPRGEPAGRIVYTCFDGEFDNICTVNPDGSDQQQLTFADATDFYASWSPRGDQIVFSSRQGGSFQIYAMRHDGEDLRRLSFDLGGGGLFSPAYSPDGDQIVFTRASGGLQNIWVMGSDGGNPIQITDTKDNIDPIWSPDGSQIAFSSTRSGDRGIYVMDFKGDDIYHLETDIPDMGGRLDWSPDGRWISFYAGKTGSRQIYMISVDGKELVQLTFEGDNLAPSFSPDGDWVTFTSTLDGDNEIYIIRVDGTDRRQVTHNNLSDWQPRWGPSWFGGD